MAKEETPNLAAQVAVAAFGALSLIGGWLIVIDGGFFHSATRHSSQAVFYSGPPAIAMALLQFTAGALAITWVLRSRMSQGIAGVAASALVFIPPLVYLFLHP